jgi:phosphonate transport system substrate-binding protein
MKNVLAALSAGLVSLALVLSPATAADKVRFAVTDIDGLESLQREMGPFKEAFQKASGLEVEFFAVSGRTAAVEAMAADQVDLVLTGPAEYVVFNARLKASPVVGWVRPDYYSQIVVLDASPVKAVADLKGKKMSFGEVGSTSQHLGPATLLTEGGLKYGTDVEPVFLKLNVAVEALIKGDIAAIGMNRTHLDRITKKFPDQKFRVVVKGNQLPDDLVLASEKVKPEVVETIRKTFTEKGADLLAAVTSTEENAKYVGGAFKPALADKDYDAVRQMYTNVGVTEFTKFMGE